MRILPLLAIFVLFIGCQNQKKKPDVSEIKVDVRIDRFERSFFAIDTNQLQAGLTDLRNGFPRFFPFYFQNILQVNLPDTAGFAVVRNVISGYKALNDSLQKKYSNLDWLHDDLANAFKYVKHYFPTYRTPAAITYIGTLDAPGVVLTPDYIGIGLHQYAGKNFSAYQDPQVQQLYPFYISRRFDKEYMVPNCLKAIVDDIYPDKSTGRPLIEQMIEKGKQWFLLDHFLPEAPDSVKTGFTKKQLAWLEENEGNAWSYMVKNENLYSIEPPTIQTYIGESPFTQGMPETSPGNLGQWLGWRIVQLYSEKHEDLSVQQILQTAPKTLFEEAKYRPK